MICTEMESFVLGCVNLYLHSETDTKLNYKRILTFQIIFPAKEEFPTK